jgi:hypothetical protein
MGKLSFVTKDTGKRIHFLTMNQTIYYTQNIISFEICFNTKSETIKLV